MLARASLVSVQTLAVEYLGRFIEDFFGNDDWEYLVPACAPALLYYDQRPLASWRRHENITRRTAWMGVRSRSPGARSRYAADVSGREIAEQLFRTGRRLVEEGRPTRGTSGISHR